MSDYIKIGTIVKNMTQKIDDEDKNAYAVESVNLSEQKRLLEEEKQNYLNEFSDKVNEFDLKLEALNHKLEQKNNAVLKGEIKSQVECEVYTTDYENIVGSESSSTQRVREWRKRKMLQCNNNVTENVTSDVTQEYRDKSIEYRDKILDNNIKENTKRKKFEKPTLEELETYKKEANLINLDTHRFLDYYDSNGWMVGKNHMKDWKATARNWNRKSNNTTPAWFNSDNQKEEKKKEEMQEVYDMFKEFRED